MQFIFIGEMLEETVINYNIYYYRVLQSQLNILLDTSNTEKSKEEKKQKEKGEKKNKKKKRGRGEPTSLHSVS